MTKDAWQTFDKLRQSSNASKIFYQQQAFSRECGLKQILEGDTIFHALDIACGDGASTESLLPFAEQIDAVDISKVLIRKAKAKGNLKHVQFFCDDFLSFDSQHTYDLITASWFHNQLHTQDAQIQIRDKIINLLSDNGKFLFLLPSAAVSHDTSLNFLRYQLNSEIGVLKECSKYSRWAFSIDGENWSKLTQWNPLYIYDLYDKHFNMRFIDIKKIAACSNPLYYKYLIPLFDILIGKKI